MFIAVLAAGVVLRSITLVTYQPAIFFADSFRYLGYVQGPEADGQRPMGYTFLFLWPLTAVHNLAVVPFIQHLFGLIMGVIIYAVVLRLGGRNWLAALAAAPVLLDAYQLQIEQVMASDALFEMLVVAALALLVLRARPTPVAAAAAGLLLGLAATVRFVGLPLLALPLAYALLRGGSWGQRSARVAALVGAAAVPLLIYSTFTYLALGQFRLGGDTMASRTVYARAAPLADCPLLAERGTPAYLMRLCPPGSPEHRTQDPSVYMHETKNPDFVSGLPPGVNPYEALRQFTSTVVRAQPLDVIRAAVGDFARGFYWKRRDWPQEWSNDNWRFHFTPRARLLDQTPHTAQAKFGGAVPHVNQTGAHFLRSYQNWFYIRGPVQALGFVLPLIAAGVLLIRRRWREPLAPGLLVSGSAFTLLASAAAYAFSWRYQLPGIPLLPLATVLALMALWPKTFTKRRTEASEEQQISEAAVERFSASYGSVQFAPVVVVMAALDEREAIGAVLDEIPREACGERVDVVVIDDGSTDGTADVAREHDAYVCRLPENAGHGIALRIGYRLAREHGARYIVTTDADGQYNGAEIPVVLQPVIDGSADLVLGSRRLGRDETKDDYRRIGVRFFAALVSALTGQHFTDTSTGLRAMRVEVPATVPQHQRQYQTSEFLIGAVAKGFRVLERPSTMRLRAAGESKKGHNALYGLRYARVVLGTWLGLRAWRARGQGQPRRSPFGRLSANTSRSNSR